MTWENKARPNKSARIPFGYVADPDNPLLLFPDETLVALVEEALDYLENGHATRKVAEWLTEKGGRKISHQGIILIWRRHRPDSKRIKDLDKATKKRRPKTSKDKKIAAVKRKRADAKRVATLMTKKLAEHEDKPETISNTLDFSSVEEQAKKQEVVFAPNPGPQTDFLAAPEREVLFGGERQAVAKATLYSQIPCAIFQILHSVDSSFAVQTTNCVNWFSSHRNSIRKRTQARNGRKRKASGRSLAEQDYG